MPLEFTFTCPLPNGLHARPASSLEEVAHRFVSSIALVNERNAMAADARSVLLMVGADVKHGDRCRVSIQGPDETEALRVVKAFVEDVLPSCDEPLPELPVVKGAVALPVSLRRANAAFLPGTPVSPGVGRGVAVFVDEPRLPVMSEDAAARACEEEWRATQDALAWLRETAEAALRTARLPTEAAVLKAQLSIIKDPALSAKLRELIFDANLPAAHAVKRAGEHFAQTMRNAESLYIQERVIDLRDICARLIARILGPAAAPPAIELTGPSIVIAANLAPSQFLAMERGHLRGLVLGHAGTTSHTVILARAFGIPTLTGVSGVLTGVAAGQDVIVDADVGALVTAISEPVERYYRQETAKRRKRDEKLAHAAALPATTKDGVRLEVAANIAVAEEAGPAFARGAEGIGLFRTEMLFLERQAAPSEDEQFAAYRQVAEAAGGRPVIIRTIDIGGDKPAPYLALPAEKNPFLGLRGARLYAQYPSLIETQLRAIVRASAHGRIKVMIPMVSRIDEVRFVSEQIRAVQAEFTQRGIGYDASMELGIMIEVPAAAFAVSRFCPEVHFFSIGTNDLAQYFLAVDRENQGVAHLYSTCDPSFIGLLAAIVRDAHAHGKWVGLCGEMAGDVKNLPLLVGLGLDEISLGARGIPEIKTALSKLDAADCRKLVSKAAACSSPQQVDEMLANLPGADGDVPLIAEELIVADSSSATKEEVIKELADALYIAGRTNDPAAVEEAVWQREQVYSTGLGFGFAIPHCKTDHVLANSIALLKPATPIEWGSQDEKPVSVVIMLAVKASDAANEHMKVFAQLARKIMHEEFRERLLKAADPREIRGLLAKTLDTAH